MENEQIQYGMTFTVDTPLEAPKDPNPEMPELRMGFCRIWRRDTQACRFCSMGGGK